MFRNARIRTTKLAKKSTIREKLGALWFAGCLAVTPQFALAGPIEDGVDWVLDLLTSGIARSAAIIAVAALGYMAFAGRLSLLRAGQIIGGVVLIFGGAAIVDVISAAVK